MPNGDPNTLIYWFAATLRQAREAGGPDGEKVPRRRVGEYLDNDVSTVNDFETGRSGWPRNPEERVEAYAELTGISQQDLWSRAVKDWVAHTKPKAKRKR